MSWTSRKATEPAAAPGTWHEIDGTLVWTWLDAILGQALILACSLESRGVGRGDQVVVVSEPRPEVLVVDEAVSRIGAQLTVIGPRSAPQEASTLIETAQPAVAFCCYREQAAVVHQLCSAEIVTFDEDQEFIPWREVAGRVSPQSWPDLPEDLCLDAGPMSDVLPLRSGDRVVCTADTSHEPVRQAIRSVLAAGGIVALSSSEAAKRTYRLLDPDGVIAPVDDLERARVDLLDRAPREMTFGDVVRALALATGVLGWAASTVGNMSTSAGRAVVAMGITCLATGFAALRGGAPRALAATAVASGAAVGLHAVGHAPSLRAALAFFVVVSVILELLRVFGHWITSALWRQGSGPGSVAADGSPLTPARTQALLTSLAERARGRVTRKALDLPSCRWVALAGPAAPDGAIRQLLPRGVEVLGLEVEASRPVAVAR